MRVHGHGALRHDMYINVSKFFILIAYGRRISIRCRRMAAKKVRRLLFCAVFIPFVSSVPNAVVM